MAMTPATLDVILSQPTFPYEAAYDPAQDLTDIGSLSQLLLLQVNDVGADGPSGVQDTLVHALCALCVSVSRLRGISDTARFKEAMDAAFASGLEALLLFRTGNDNAATRLKMGVESWGLLYHITQLVWGGLSERDFSWKDAEVGKEWWAKFGHQSKRTTEDVMAQWNLEGNAMLALCDGGGYEAGTPIHSWLCQSATTVVGHFAHLLPPDILVDVLTTQGFVNHLSTLLQEHRPELNPDPFNGTYGRRARTANNGAIVEEETVGVNNGYSTSPKADAATFMADPNQVYSTVVGVALMTLFSKASSLKQNKGFSDAFEAMLELMFSTGLVVSMVRFLEAFAALKDTTYCHHIVGM